MTRHTFRFAALPAALLLLGFTHTAYAQDVYFSSNATIDATHSVAGSAYIGFDSTMTIATSPTVDLVSGGSIGVSARAYHSSIFNISGSIGGSAFAYNSSTIDITGGSIGLEADAFDNSTIDISGGSIATSLTSLGSSTINIRGGSIGQYFFVFDNSRMNFYGTGLSDVLTDSNALNAFSKYALSGTLADGTSVNGKYFLVQNGSTARVTLNDTAVPEPGSVALLGVLGLGGLSLLARRKCAA